MLGLALVDDGLVRSPYSLMSLTMTGLIEMASAIAMETG